jgi:tetratricopeptide (TPR) repeat protein
MWRSAKNLAVQARRIKQISSRALALVLALALGMASQSAVGEPFEESPDASSSDVDYAAGKLAMDKQNWAEAVTRLQQAAMRLPDSADLNNYLGFSYRQLGKMDLAFAHYKRALAANPRHLGAHEYIGEAYLMINDLAGAEKHLAALQQICLLPCEELADLDEAIKSYRVAKGRTAKKDMRVAAPVARP